jgi:predicted metal-binding membrane protein
MIVATEPAAREGRRFPLLIPAAIAGAWLLAIAAQITGKEALLHHDTLIEHSGLPLWASLVIFLVAWQAMTAAMMLPSSLPMIRLFGKASANQERPGRAMAAFLGAYALVWTGFGTVAFLGDAALHRMVDRTPWLAAHPWLIGGSVLGLAGLFQFSALKDKCLSECRHPGAFLLQHYGRGARAAFRLGRKHGVFCLGCCWALMLLMFAVGVAHLWWMAALAALMVYEKVGRNGDRAVPWAGITLLGLAAAVFAQFPPWLPQLLSH